MIINIEAANKIKSEMMAFDMPYTLADLATDYWYQVMTPSERIEVCNISGQNMKSSSLTKCFKYLEAEISKVIEFNSQAA